jgi:oligosaccharide repeat unit polymerase
MASRQWVVVWAVFAVSLGMFAVYLGRLERIPLLEIARGNVAEADYLRSKAGNAFPGKYHWFYLFLNVVLPFLTYLALSEFVLRKSVGALLALLVTLPVTAFAVAVTGAKSPLALLLIGMLLTWFHRRGGRIPLRTAVVAGLAVFALMVPIFAIFLTGDKGIGDAIAELASRLFTGGITPAYFYVDTFPASVEFLGGRSFPNPRSLFPFENFPLSHYMSDLVYPTNRGLGITGTMPTVFWAELYANFGPWAPLPVAFGVGVALQAIQALVDRLRDSSVRTALTVWLALHLKSLAEGNFSDRLIDLYLWSIVALSAVLLAAGRGSRSVTPGDAALAAPLAKGR